MSTRQVLPLWLVVLCALSIANHVYAHPSGTTDPPPQLSKRMQRWTFGPWPFDNVQDYFAAGARRGNTEAEEGFYRHPRLELDRDGRRPYSIAQQAEPEPGNGYATNSQRLATPDALIEAANLRLNDGLPFPHSYEEGVSNLVRSMNEVSWRGERLPAVWIRKWIEQVAQVVPHTKPDLRTALDTEVRKHISPALVIPSILDRFDTAQGNFQQLAAEDGLSFGQSPDQLEQAVERLDESRRGLYWIELLRMADALRELDKQVATSKEIADDFHRRVGELRPGRRDSDTAVPNDQRLSQWGFDLAHKAEKALRRFNRFLEGVCDDRHLLFPPEHVQAAFGWASQPSATM